MDSEYFRIIEILHQLPLIRSKIKNGDRWKEIEYLCKPLGLDDTNFRYNPSLNDYIVSYSYWIGKLQQQSKEVEEVR